MCVCIYLQYVWYCYNSTYIPLRAVISINQVEFLMERLRESKTVWNVCVGHRKGGEGSGGGCLESDPFSKSLLLFPSRLCFKTGKLLAFEKYPFPICCAAAPVVITLPLPAALLERR